MTTVRNSTRVVAGGSCHAYAPQLHLSLRQASGHPCDIFLSGVSTQVFGRGQGVLSADRRDLSRGHTLGGQE